MKRFLFAFTIFSIVVVVSSLSFAGECYTKPGYFCALSKAALERAYDYAAQKDDAALQDLIDSDIVVPLKAGLKVYRMESTWTLVKIRQAGQHVGVWTAIEAIDCR